MRTSSSPNKRKDEDPGSRIAVINGGELYAAGRRKRFEAGGVTGRLVAVLGTGA